MGFNISLSRFGAQKQINCTKCNSLCNTYVDDLDIEDYLFGYEEFYKHELVCNSCSHTIKMFIKLSCKTQIM